MGWPHPDYLLEQLSSTQLLEWQAYYRLEPFGYIRHDFHAAGITHMLAAINRDPKRKMAPLEEFVLFPEPASTTPTPVKQSEKHMRSIVDRIHEGVKAREKRKSM